MNNIEVLKRELSTYVSRSLSEYNTRIYRTVKPTIDELKFKEQYQGRIIDCMVGEVDDNYIETPETDAPIVKLEHSKEGVVKIPSIKGKTILVDADGNETDTPAEGCRLVSVGEEDNKLIILSKNKNLFDNSERVNGYYWSADNTETKHDNSYLSRTYIKVNQETYVTNGNTQVLEYDKNKNFIRRVQVTNLTYTPKENVGYIRLSYYNHGIDFKGQFELGNISTTYIEPKHHKTEILLGEPLRKINDYIYDEIVGNKLIQNTKKVVLDGSEHWATRAGSANIISYCFECRLGTMGISQYSTPCISNNLPTNIGAWIDVEHIWLNEWGSATVHISAEKIGEYDVDKFREWLSDNPIELIYQIEPVIIEMPNTLTLQGFDDTTMYIENSITPTVSYGYNALIPYKEELSNQKEEVEINTLDIENNIIPYLMDMEFNLMLMEDN